METTTKTKGTTNTILTTMTTTGITSNNGSSNGKGIKYNSNSNVMARMTSSD